MQNTKDTYHKKSFKTKNLMKEDYKELVNFCDELLIDEDKMNKKINDLKKENLKLIQTIDILKKNEEEQMDTCFECATDCIKNSMNLACNGKLYCDKCWEADDGEIAFLAGGLWQDNPKAAEFWQECNTIFNRK